MSLSHVSERGPDATSPPRRREGLAGPLHTHSGRCAAGVSEVSPNKPTGTRDPLPVTGTGAATLHEHPASPPATS